MRRWALVAAALAFAATAGDDARSVPQGFVPLDAAIALDGRPADFMLPDTIDLAWGVSMISCPSGAWRGTVRFVGHAGGDIEYTGDMYGCFTFGKGTARFAGGSTYTGSVNAYVAAGLDGFTRLTTDGVRMAVPEGVGTAARVGVAAQQQAFVRGAPSVDPRDPRFAALDVALVGLGRDAVAASDWIIRTVADPAAAIEKGIANVEREAAGVERAALVAGAQAERLGTQVVKQGVAVSADAEAFARRAGKEAEGAGAVVDKVGGELGALAAPKPSKASGKSTTSLGNIGGVLDKPQSDIGAKLMGGGAKPSGASAGASGAATCIAGRWQRASCGGRATVELSFSGGERGTGYRSEGVCPSSCPQGARTDFRYALAGDGTLQLESTGGASCGGAAPALQPRQALTCSADALRLDGDYQRVAR